MAVARTSAIVGNNAAKISTRSPPRVISSRLGTSSRMNSMTTPSIARMIRLSRRRRGNVRRMNRPSAAAPHVAVMPCAWPDRMVTSAAPQATVSRPRRRLRISGRAAVSGASDDMHRHQKGKDAASMTALPLRPKPRKISFRTRWQIHFPLAR